MAHFEVRGKGHFEVRGKLPPCAIHGMVDQRWRTARDQRRVQRRMLDNSGACICGSQIYMKRAKIQCMFKAPFLWATINSPSEVDLWRRRRKIHVVQVFHTRTEPHTFAGFNHAQNLSAGNLSDLNEWLPCSSQTACICPLIAHVHPPGDVNWSICGLPWLRVLLPTSCVQGAYIMMIIDRNEEANLWRKQLFWNNAQKNLSVTIMSDCLSTRSMKMFKLRVPPLPSKRPLDGRIKSDS